MAAEGNLRKKLKARVEAYGGEIRALAYLGRAHCPDVLVLFKDWNDGTPGHHVFVETKGVEPDARPRQKAEHERMRAAGCTVLVIRNEAELDAWLPPVVAGA